MIKKAVRLLYLAALWCLCFRGLYEAVSVSAESLKYYTNLSNALVLLLLTAQTVLCIINLKRETDLCIPALLKGGAVMGILITFITYWSILNQFLPPLNFHDATVHYLVPLLTVAEFLIFEPHGRLRLWHPPAWLALPLSYYGFVVVMRLSDQYFDGREYPYFFMDFSGQGWTYVVTVSLILLSAFLTCGYLLWLADHILAKSRRRSPNQI